MATISNAIIMQDKMTPVFNKINSAMENTLKVLRKVNSSVGQGISEREFKKAENAIKQADKALNKYKSDIEKANQASLNLRNPTNKSEGSNEGESDKKSKDIKEPGFLNPSSIVGAAQKGIELVTKGAEYLDELSLMQSRVKVINDGMQTTNALQDKILASANRAGASYKDTTEAVTKLSMTAGNQFKNNDQAISFVETLNKMFAISGTSGKDASSAMEQVTKAMEDGKLKGDDFNSILQKAPILANAIAKSMGKSKEELKDISSEGGITADIIKKAMNDATKDVNKQFDSMPMTFGQKMTILKNNFMNAMEPVAARFSQWLNSSNATTFLNDISDGFVVLSNMGVMALEGIANAASWLKENFIFIEPILIALSMLMLILKVQSVLAAISSAIAWAMANVQLLVIVGVITLIIFVFNLLGINIASVISTVISWISGLIDVLIYLMPVIISIGAAIIAYFLIPMLIAAIQAIPGMIISLVGLMMSLWETIQILALYALEWLAANWIMLLVAVAIGIVIFILIQLGVTAADVVGFIVGLFYALVAIIENAVIIPLYNKFAMFANFLNNLFIDPIGAIQMLFLDMATYIVDKVRWVAQSLQDLVNMIPGVEVNIVGNLDNIKSAIESAKSDVKSKRGVKETKFKKYENIGESFNKGFNKGHDFASSLGSKGSIFGNLLSMFKMPKLPDGIGMDKGMGMPNFSNNPMTNGSNGKGKGPGSGVGGAGKMPAGLSDKINGGKLDKIGKIEDDVKITDEDIKMLKDISKAEFINKYTTLRPNMKVEFTGPVTETADINKILSAIEDMTEEALSNTIVEGVYA